MLRIALLVYKCLVFISLGTCLNYSHVDLFKNIFLKILGMAITKVTSHCAQTNMHGRKVSKGPIWLLVLAWLRPLSDQSHAHGDVRYCLSSWNVSSVSSI
jgi:hypothetical protein